MNSIMCIRLELADADVFKQRKLASSSNPLDFGLLNQLIQPKRPYCDESYLSLIQLALRFVVPCCAAWVWEKAPFLVLLRILHRCWQAP